MSLRRRKIPFVRPPKEGAHFFAYVWYVIKLVIATLASIISIPFVYLGFLTGLLAWMLILCIGVAGIVYVKVYPDFKHCREVAYDTVISMKDADFHKLSDTEIYDREGTLIGTINAGHYEYVDIKDISMNIQNAYIDQEDRRFKTHPGFDWMAIIRAGIAYVKNNGKVTQGASTITQQVIKNTYLSQEKTLTRKVTEVLLAPELEKKYGKNKIMEFYCNGNFYGHHCYGVQAASRYYFGKTAKEVDPWEAALLVGISNSPTNYDPVKHPDAAKAKRDEVLKSMEECGTITAEQRKEYQKKALNIVQEYAGGTSENYMTSYAIHCAAQELMKNDKFEFRYTFTSQSDYDTYQASYSSAYANKSEEIRNGGYRIYTTLDQAVQNVAQTHLDDGLKTFTEKQDNGKYAMQGAVVVINNTSGNVVAVIGGRGTDDEYNRSYLAVRQPGSTIKPLLDYGPAFDTGEYYPSKIIDDHQWENGPQNSGGSYYGHITIREALNRSLNTVAWQVLQGIGRDAGLKYLGKLHFQTLTYIDNSVDAIAIGGFTNGTRPVDMAKGYEALANGGVYDSHTCIRSIKTDKADTELYDDEGVKEQVYSADTAYMLTDILKGTMDKSYGTGYGLDIKGQQAAGKTGTTNSNKDTWFCGYTKYYTTAVWVGYDIPRPMPGIFGSTYAGKIWHDIMTDLHDGVPEQDWECPPTVTRSYYNPETGTKSNADYSRDNYDEDEDEEETGKKNKNSQPAREISADTEGTDLFSSNADAEKVKAQHERDQKLLTDKTGDSLKTFEAYQISAVKDTFGIDKMYTSLMKDITLIEDDAVRADYSKRAVLKNDELQAVINGMQDDIERYSYVREMEESRSASEAASEAESRRSNDSVQIRVNYFVEKVASLRAMKYRQDDVAQALIRDAQNTLSELADYDGYNGLLNSLNDAIANYRLLPSKPEWDMRQTSKTSAAQTTRAAGAGVTGAAGGPGVTRAPIISGTTATTSHGPGVH